MRITLRVDRSVAKFFRAMGPGYQARINRVLRTYARFRMSKAQELWAYMETRGYRPQSFRK